MSPEFYYGFNVIMLSRWIYTFRDKPIGWRRCLAVIGLSGLGFLVYALDLRWLGLVLLIGLANGLFYWLERQRKTVVELRILSLLVSLVILNFFFSEKIGLGFSSSVVDWIATHKGYLFLIEGFNSDEWLRANILLMGSLLVANEVNIGIRYGFRVLDLEPKKKDQEKQILDVREYNAGRVIGILERLLIYIFVLGDQFLAIGLILTAKGLARFKELEERQFAEYILIGTLLSTLLAVMVAALIRSLLSVGVSGA